MYTDIIWDFDGTLVDTYPSMVRSMMQALQEMGVQYDQETVWRMMRESVRYTAEQAEKQHGVDKQALMRAYRKNNEKVDPFSVRMFPKAKEALQRVCEKEGKNFIFTHRGTSIFPYLQAHGIEKYFTAVVCQEQGFQRKPSGEGNRYIMRTYGAVPGKTLAVGDREIDIAAAHDADIKACFYAPYGRVETDAAYIIETYAELAPLIG